MANAWIVKPLTPVSIVATTPTTALGAASYLANDYAGVIWRGNPGTPTDWLVDFGADQSIDTILIFGLVSSNPAATLQIFAATAAEGGSFATASFSGDALPLYAGSVMPVSGKGVGIWSAPAGFPTGVRYLLMRMGWTGGAITIEASRLVVGKRIQLERNFGMGGNFGVRDLGTLDFSPQGVLMRRRAKKLRTAGLTFSNVRKDEVEAKTKPLLEQIGNTEMIALVTDPSVDPQRQNRCYFGPLVGDLGHTQRNAVAWEAKVNVVSIF